MCEVCICGFSIDECVECEFCEKCGMADYNCSYFNCNDGHDLCEHCDKHFLDECECDICDACHELEENCECEHCDDCFGNLELVGDCTCDNYEDCGEHELDCE